MRLIDAEHLKWNVGGIKCGTLTVAYLNWILEHEEPTVDAEPVRHGKWKRTPSNWGALFECSECGETTTETVMGYPRYVYCPMCGAKMDAERKE